MENMPLWKWVSVSLQKDIEQGLYAQGDKLSGEYELCKKFHVSRITVRSALSRLEDLGLVKRIKGKGTVVLKEKIKEPLLKIQGFSQEMKDKGIIPGTAYAHIEMKEVSGYVSEIFGLPKSARLKVLERIRTINSVPVGYFVTYLSPKINLSCADKDYYSSLYDKIRTESGITVDRIRQKISAENACPEVRRALGLKSFSPVLVMKRWAYSGNDLIEFSVCRYDAEKYEYEMEL